MRAERLRERILADDLLITPEIYDGLSAKIAEDEGFDAAIMGGFAASATFGLGEPLLSMAEMRDQARRVTHSTDLPFVVDGATGFGNPAHTYRSVKEFAEAGVAGVFIEDQVDPRAMKHHDEPLELVSVEEMEAKIEAAVRAREESENDIVVLAKTQAATADRAEYETMEDAAERMNRYFEAGAEAGCLYPRTESEAQYVVDNVDGPLKFAVVPSKDYCPDFETVEEMGFALANTPTVATAEAAKRLREHYRTLADSGEITASGEDVTEFKSYVYDLQYDGYERYE